MSCTLLLINPIKNVSLKEYDETKGVNPLPLWSDNKKHDFMDKFPMNWHTKCSNRILSNISNDYWFEEKIYDEFPKEFIIVFDQVLYYSTWNIRNRFLKKKFTYYMTSSKDNMMKWLYKNIKFKNNFNMLEIIRSFEKYWVDGMIFYVGF